MTNHPRRRLSERGVGVVAKGHDAGIGDLQGQEIFQPECLRLRVCPGLDRVATESVHGHDTRGKAAVSETDSRMIDRSQRSFRRDLLDGGRRGCIVWRVNDG